MNKIKKREFKHLRKMIGHVQAVGGYSLIFASKKSKAKHFPTNYHLLFYLEQEGYIKSLALVTKNQEEFVRCKTFLQMGRRFNRPTHLARLSSRAKTRAVCSEIFGVPS